MSKISKTILAMLVISLLVTVLEYNLGNFNLSRPYDIGYLIAGIIGIPAISVCIAWLINCVANFFRKNKRSISIIVMWVIFSLDTAAKLFSIIIGKH